MYTSYSATQLKNRKGKPWQMVVQGSGVKKKTKMAREAKGKKEAERLAQEWMEELNAALTNSVSSLGKTVDEVVEARLAQMLKLGLLEKSTYYMYMNNYKNNVKPYIGGLNFKEVDRVDLEIWITKLHNKGLRQNSIYNCYTVPKMVYSYFYKIGEIERNPFDMISVPKGDKRVSHMDRKLMDDFLEAVYAEYDATDAMYSALLLMYYAGLRRSEVCGLRYRDINFEDNTISITSAIGRGDKENYTKPPKNKSSIRTFPLIPQLREALLARYNFLKPSNSWFVVGDEEKFLTPSALSKRMNKFVDAYGLVDVYGKKLTSHALRHNLGMVGIKSGMDISSLSKMFGHASRSMTLDRYGDYSPDAAKVAAGKLSETFDEGSFFKEILEEDKSSQD